MRLATRLLTHFWPGLMLMTMLIVAASEFEGTTLYHAGQVGATVACGWVIFAKTPFPRIRNKLVWMAAAACFFAGLYGLEVELDRWLPWWQIRGASLGVMIANLNYPLVLISGAAVVSPVFMLFSTPILLWIQGYRDGLRPGNGAHGTARWMNLAERLAYFDREDPAGRKLVVGEHCDLETEPQNAGKAPLLLYDIAGRGHAITVGPTGMGKTRGLVSPNLLHWSRSLVCLDLKGDLHETFAPVRRAMGRDVYVLDVNAAGGNTDAINVLSWLDPTSDTIISDARSVANWLAGDDPQHNSNPVFRGTAKDLIHLAVLEMVCNTSIPPQNRTLEYLKYFLDAPDIKTRLIEISNRPFIFTGGAAQGMANGFLGIIAADETWGGVLFEKSHMTAWLAQPNLRRLVSGEPTGTGRTLPLHQLTDGKTDVFVSLSLDVLETTPELSRLIFGSLISTVLRHGRQHRRSKLRTLFLLDEMPRFGYMKILETARDAGRPFIILWPFIQDLSQLTKVYGEGAIRSWLANSAIRSFIAVDELETAEYVSKWIGTETVELRQTGMQGGQSWQSGQLGSSRNAGQSVNSQVFGRPLKDPSQIMLFRTAPGGGTDEQYMFLRGARPLHCTLPLWDRHPAFTGMV